MGLEFINSKAKKPIRKGWDRERTKLSAASLFRGARENIRTISVSPREPECFVDGGEYELQAVDKHIYVYIGPVLIGVCEQPPQSVLNAICLHGGKTQGAFYGIREHSGLIDIAVCLEE